MTKLMMAQPQEVNLYKTRYMIRKPLTCKNKVQPQALN